MPFEYTIDKHRENILILQQGEDKTAAKNVKITPLFYSLDKSKLVLFIYRPFHFTQGKSYPTVLHIRGTGFNTSARYYAHITCSHLTEKSNCQVIDIDHRLAPEYPYPIGLDDIYSSIKYIIKHAKALRIDLEKIAILGYSSGGNFAALAAIRAKKDKLPITLQFLVSPVIDLSCSLKKFVHFENKDSFPPWLTQWFIKLYLPDTYDPKSPEVSPYWSNELTHLPPTYFLLSEFDRFRSDGEAYRDKLGNANVWTHLSVFKKEIHSFYWRNIRVNETIATQLRMGFNLFTIPKPLTYRPFEKEEKRAFTFKI